MFCKQCGTKNADDSAFCVSCGSALGAGSAAPAAQPEQQPGDMHQQPYAPQQPGDAYQQPFAPQQPGDMYQQPYAPQQPGEMHQPPQGYYQQPYAPQQQPKSAQKKKTGLIVGLAVGGFVLLAAAAALLYFFVFSGTPAEGVWHHAQRGWVIAFENDNELIMHALTGESSASYDYDKGKAKGSFTADGTTYDFMIKDGRMALAWSGGQAAFEKADKDADIERLVLGALNGVWVNEDAIEALTLDRGKMTVHTTSGDLRGSYTYSIKDAKGTVSFNGSDYSYWATHEKLDFGELGIYYKADSSFDISTFLSESGSSIEGTWYDTMGENGTITFFNDGYAEIVHYGETYYATYTFDRSSGSGTISLTDETVSIYLWGNILQVEDRNYTRDFVSQLGADALTPPIIGLWYESSGMLGSLYFFSDGTVELYKDGISNWGTYSYDRPYGTGQYKLDNDVTTSYTMSYSESTETLIVNGYIYTRDYVAPATQETGIVGTWYSITGEFGIFTFDAYGGCTIDIYGASLRGSYSFDDATGKGTLLMFIMDDSETAQLSLENGLLDVEGELFTKDYVAQQN